MMTSRALRVSVSRCIGVLALSVFAAWPSQAAVTLPAVFGDHMVLQRDRALPVWGTDAPGTAITVRLGEASVTGQAGADGTWRVALPAQAASAEPRALVVEGSSTVTLQDVLVGEVWVCSGQSNMELTVTTSDGGAAAVAEATDAQIRLFHIPKVPSALPQPNVEATWKVCSPETVPTFTAVGYYFGRELRRELGVPVGLINASWGGTRIEPWTPLQGFAGSPRLQDLHTRALLALPSSPMYKERLQAHLDGLAQWLDQARAALPRGEVLPPQPVLPRELLPMAGRQDPMALYHGMIHAIVPYAIRGALWYQGEANLVDGPLYTHKMEALIRGWRQAWGQGDFPFYWVQLAPYTYGVSPRALPRLWEAQERALAIPNTGMAVINDIGNLKDIHPRNKLDVGRRLSLIALANAYGREGLVWSSPRLREHKVVGANVHLRFDHVGTGLRSRDGQPLTWFELIGADGVAVKADARIGEPDEVIVSAAGLAEPVGVRFAWDQHAEPNLANSAGLPVGAFRAGATSAPQPLEALTPLARGYRTVYRIDIPESPAYNDAPIEYAVNESAEITGLFDRVAYCLELQKPNEAPQFVFVSMDAFTQEIAKIGVPTLASGAIHQRDVARLAVASNVDGVPTGEDLGTGNLEFWYCNYGPRNSRPVPGASDTAFDFGDGDLRPGTKGYGSMQIHLPSRQATLIAFNRWGSGVPCDIGLGNRPTGNSDWTFAANAAQYSVRRLTVLVRTDD